MASVHTQDLAIYSSKPINEGETASRMVRYKPSETKKSYGCGEEIEFDISASSHHYIDLSKSELYVKLRLWKDKEKKTPFKYNDKNKAHIENEFAIPIDAILHTLWKNVDISLNQTPLTSCTNNYMYKSYLETLLCYGASAKKNQLHSIGFTGNDEHFESTHPYKLLNSGAIKRHEMLISDDALNSSEGGLELVGPLMLDICSQKAAIINGVDVYIKLEPNKEEFVLMTHPSTLKCFIEIADIYLDIFKIDVTPDIAVGHDNALFNNQAVYEYQKSEINFYNIPKGSFNFYKEDIFNNKTPSRTFVMFVKSAAYNGNNQLNPLQFESLDIDTVTLYWNSIPVRKPYKIDVNNSSYMDTYLGMYRSLGKLFDDTDIGISREQFKKGLTIFSFVTDPTAAPDLSYIGTRTTGRLDINVDMKPGKPTDENITVLIYGTFPGTLGIDNARVVTDLSHIRYHPNGQELLQKHLNKSSPIDITSTTATAAAA